jgi:hypothetical protein
VLALAACGESAKRSDPQVPRLITKSLQAARAHESVVFHVDLTLGAKLDRDAPRELTVLADNPFHLTLDGIRTDQVLTAEGTLEAAGSKTELAVLQFKDRLSLRLGTTWYRMPTTIGGLFQGESLAALVPMGACVRNGASEGCDEVDFVPALERGDVGRLVQGTVERKGGETVIRGTVDASGFTVLKTGTTPERKDTRGIYDSVLRTLQPYEDAGKVEFTIGEDGLPRRFVLEYRLDEDAMRAHMRGSFDQVVERTARLEIELSNWDTGFDLVMPGSQESLPPEAYQNLFLALVLYV